MPDEKINGWNEWSRHVLMELERLNGCYADVEKRLQAIELAANKLSTEFNLTNVEKRLRAIELALTKLTIEFKLKAGVWGLMAGAIPVIITLLYLWIKHGLGQ